MDNAKLNAYQKAVREWYKQMVPVTTRSTLGIHTEDSELIKRLETERLRLLKEADSRPLSMEQGRYHHIFNRITEEDGYNIYNRFVNLARTLGKDQQGSSVKNMNLYYIDCNLVWESEPKADQEPNDEHFLQALSEFNKRPSKVSSIHSFHIAAEYPDQIMPVAKGMICRSYPTVLEEKSRIWVERVETAVGLGGRKFRVRLEEFRMSQSIYPDENSQVLFFAKNDVEYLGPNGEEETKMRDFHIASQYPDLAAYVAFANLKMEFPTLIRKGLNTRITELLVVNGVDSKKYAVRLDEIVSR